MFKKLIIVFIFLIICMPAYAITDISDTFEKIPTIKTGMAYSTLDSQLLHSAMITVFEWKGVQADVGYIGREDNTKDQLAAAITYPVVNMKDLGVNVPIVDLIEFELGWYVGSGRITGNNEFDTGAILNIMKVKF